MSLFQKSLWCSNWCDVLSAMWSYKNLSITAMWQQTNVWSVYIWDYQLITAVPRLTCLNTCTSDIARSGDSNWPTHYNKQENTISASIKQPIKWHVLVTIKNYYNHDDNVLRKQTTVQRIKIILPWLTFVSSLNSSIQNYGNLYQYTFILSLSFHSCIEKVDLVLVMYTNKIANIFTDFTYANRQIGPQPIGAASRINHSNASVFPFCFSRGAMASMHFVW